MQVAGSLTGKQNPSRTAASSDEAAPGKDVENPFELQGIYSPGTQCP